MRLKALFSGDIRIQARYGFFFLYAVFTVLYIALLYALPVSWRRQGAVLMIFSDPAAMGLFFMGAIVLFEKSGRTISSIAVSPVKPWEYTLSKLLSIALTSLAVAVVIAAVGNGVAVTLYFIFSVILCSCLFSAVGLIVAAGSATLNGFVLSTIPAEILINLPAIAYLFGWDRRWLLLHPGVCMIECCLNGPYRLPAAVILAAWTALAAACAARAVKKMLMTAGGMKL